MRALHMDVEMYLMLLIAILMGASAHGRIFTPIEVPEYRSAVLDQTNNRASAQGQGALLLPATERSLLDWNPSYPVNLPVFNTRNFAFFRERHSQSNTVPPGGFQFFNAAGVKQRRSYQGSILSLFPSGTRLLKSIGGNGRRDTSGIFSESNVLFSLVGFVIQQPGRAQSEKVWILIHSDDDGLNWNAYIVARASEFARGQCPERYRTHVTCKFPADVDMERTFTPRMQIGSAPAILLWESQGDWDPNPNASDFDKVGRLSILTLIRNPVTKEISVGKFIPIGQNVLGIGSHSGGANRIVGLAGRLFVTWVQATRQGGSPTVVAMYDSVTQLITTRTVASSFPANDSHNQPGIVMTPDQKLHVITGAHGRHMFHTHSLRPLSIDEWSPPVAITMHRTGDAQVPMNGISHTITGGAQTYLSMVTDSLGQLHVVYRQGRIENARFGGYKFLVLAYQKYANGVWSEPKVLVYPNLSGYFAYYHQMTIDRMDNLYLAYSRWSLQEPYCRNGDSEESCQEIIPKFRQPALLKSSNRGGSWYLATDQDIRDGNN